MKNNSINLINVIFKSTIDGSIYIVTIVREYTEKLKTLCTEYKAIFKDNIDTIFTKTQSDVYKILSNLPGGAIYYGFSTK